MDSIYHMNYFIKKKDINEIFLLSQELYNRIIYRKIMFNNLTKRELYSILTGVFTASLVISNVISSKTFEFYIFIFPCAIIIFPIVYILDDIFAEIYGYEKARRIIFLGFLMNFVAVICFQITIAMPAPSFFLNNNAYSIVLGSTTRILIGSVLSYLIGSLVNAKVMVILKAISENKLFFRCILSTVIGGGLDAIIFISIVFYGVIPFYALLIMIIGQASFKVIYEIAIYPITRLVIKFIKALPDE